MDPLRHKTFFFASPPQVPAPQLASPLGGFAAFFGCALAVGFVWVFEPSEPVADAVASEVEGLPAADGEAAAVAGDGEAATLVGVDVDPAAVDVADDGADAPPPAGSVACGAAGAAAGALGATSWAFTG